MFATLSDLNLYCRSKKFITFENSFKSIISASYIGLNGLCIRRALDNKVLNYRTKLTHPFLVQMTFAWKEKMSSLELSPEKREEMGGVLFSILEDWYYWMSCISFWQQQYSKWQALSGNAFIFTGKAVIAK